MRKKTIPQQSTVVEPEVPEPENIKPEVLWPESSESEVCKLADSDVPLLNCQIERTWF